MARRPGLPGNRPDRDRAADRGRSFRGEFWRYYPQRRPKPGAAALGAILRDLHELPAPPIDLPRYRPLARLGDLLAHATQVADGDRDWLDQQRTDLLTRYEDLRSELGEGFIHGDAYPGNTLWHDDRVILGDWDEVAYGPRELDLVNTHQGARLGRGLDERAAFTEAYGWDVTTWGGYPILRAMRDLHTLAAYIERSNTDPSAEAELRHRIRTLRDGDLSAHWRIT